jgi:lauroyl/myristoyl acyltransferase
VLLDSGALKRYFGTDEPEHGLIEECKDLFEDIRRGEAVCFAVDKDGRPDEWFFAGFSFD